MQKHGKKYKAAAAQVEADTAYSPEKAVALAKATSYSKFNATVEAHIRLGVDPKYADQNVRDVVVLPNGLGKTVRVLVFAEGEGARVASANGADHVADDELIKQIQAGWAEFDVAIATPDLMGKVGRLGRILGPRGLMPNPKTGTVTDDTAKAVKEVKAGRVEFKLDKNGNIAVPVGKFSFEQQALVENGTAVIDAVVKARPATAKGVFVENVTLSATMSPGLRVDASSFLKS